MPPNAIEPIVFRETLRNILTTTSAAEQQQASSTTQVAVLTRIFIDECQSLLDSNTPLPTDSILGAVAHLHETSSAYQSHVTAGSDHRPHTPTSQTGVRSAQRSPRANKAQKDADRIDTTDVAWNDLLKAHTTWQKSGHDSSSLFTTGFLSIMKMHRATLLRSFPLLKEVRIDPTIAECLAEFSSHLNSLASLVPKLEPIAAICFLIRI
ncbi:related to SNF1-related protein kinase KIN10 [Sporisorium scitamineum]|uniref:Related to SNF1-related protein kinase KIN10 n=1 Tax=Sporisorium scitamineum TaxID=49012 RepID=A0A127ZCB0_9BASI|nr:related to SNF1-related protein kinase KIN10 [Sporisorium scitamineum]